MTLDMRTVMFSYVISSALCAAVMAFLWLLNRRRSPELVFWLADFGMQFAGVTLIALRGRVPNFFSMVIGNTLVIAGTLLLYIGLERYTRKTSPQWYNFLYLAAFFCVHAYFTYIQPSLQARNINTGLGLLVICSQIAWLLLGRVDREMRQDTRPAGLVFAFFALVGLARIFLDLVVSPGNDYFQSNLYETLVVVLYQMLYIGLTFTLFLLVNRRLVKTLEDDVTERRRMEEMLRRRLELLEYAVAHSLEELLVKTLDEVGELTGSPIGFYHFVDADQQNLSLQAWSTRTMQEYCTAAGKGSHYPIDQAGIWVDCVKTKKPVIHNDYASEPGRKGLPEGHAPLIRELVVPILRADKIVAILGVGNKPGNYTRQDVETVSYFADIAWESAARKWAEVEIQVLNKELEQRVEDRTRELRDAQERLVRQERLATLGQLAGSVGHELRNPLGVMSNAVYFLKMTQPDASAQVREYLGIIENEIRTSNKIVTDLLDFTRIKSVEKVQTAVYELVRQTLERYPVPATVQVQLEIPAELPPVFADPQHVIQILGNLTLNACQAMKADGRLLIRAVSSEVDGKSSVAISVIDNGLGIPPENMAKLFEPLFTTKPNGIGLGLAVSQKLAGANGGRIEVQSEPGQGSTFTLYLPAGS
jgi:signal transduction histidine kinase